MLRERRQQRRPVRRHHVVVGWRDRRRERDLELHIRGNDAGFLQLLEQAPGRDRHLGIAGFERVGIGLGARLDPKARDFTQHLAVPLRELEGRHVCGDLDCRVFGKNSPAKTGSRSCGCRSRRRAVAEDRPSRFGECTEHGFGIRQRNAADEVDDRMLAAVGGHGVLPGGGAVAPILTQLPAAAKPLAVAANYSELPMVMRPPRYIRLDLKAAVARSGILMIL